MAPLFPIHAYDHVGIRVSDREEALAFYGKLGFRVESEDDDGDLELINAFDLRINLIPNGVTQAGAHNVLLDNPVKYPGITHPAFVVPDLDIAIREVRKASITITEGPKESARRRYFFIRDPDGNVLEFNELRRAA